MGDFASCSRCCCSIRVSALAKSFPRFLLRLLTLRAFYRTRARLTLEPSRLASLCASLRFLSASEREPQSPAELPSAPALAQGFGSRLKALAQVWQVPLGVRGAPCAPGGHAGRAASRPRPDRGALGDPSEKRKAGPAGPARARCAHPARTRRTPARLPTCCTRVFRRAERRVSRRAERRVSRRAERRVSRRAKPRVSRRAERCVSARG